jgi:hypothetical protein
MNRSVPTSEGEIMSALKWGLAAVLVVGGWLALGSPARAQDYYAPVVPAPVVVVPAPVVPAPVVVYSAPAYYPVPVVVRPRPVVAVVARPVRAAVYTVRPRVFIP